MDAPWLQQVNRFCNQYLQLEVDFDFPADEYLRLPDVQDYLYTHAFCAQAADTGPPTRYRIRALKTLVSKIESAIDDWNEHAVSDDLMSTLCSLISTPLPPEPVSAQKKCYVSYHLSLLDQNEKQPNGSLEHPQNDPSITLLESRGLIAAGGSTGHRTWEAGLHMGQYLCINPSLVEGKHILELGTGTGYVSILCAKYLKATHVTASDGSDDVINHLPENLFLNGLQESSRIVPMDIKWGHALLGTEEDKWNGGKPVDVVLGTDITYDHRAVPALVSTLMELFAFYPQMEVYISAAERNEQTFQVFLDVCQQNQLVVNDLEFRVPPHDEQPGPFYDDSVAIRICHVSTRQ